MFELAVIVALITGVGQVFKNFVPNKFMPIVSLGLGIAAGFGFVDASVQEQVFTGVAVGLAASGLFDVAKLPSKVKK